MAELRIYGGDPRVIATLEELKRVAILLARVADILRSSIWNLASNPIANLQLGFLVPAISDRLDQLARFCDLAASEYFSTEQQISAKFRTEFELWQQTGKLIAASPGPAMISGGITATTVAALAISGLTQLPSQSATSHIRGATALAPVVIGTSSVPAAVRNVLPLLGKPLEYGARLVQYQSQLPAKNLYEHARKLRALYQTPGQIQIERYQLGSANQFVVYIPGTQVFSSHSPNPLSAKSNLYAMAKPGLAPSEQSVRAALNQAGIGRQDRVLLIGHSQGALIASNIAVANPGFRVSGLISFGGPIAHADLTGIPTVALENSADPVPALGGMANPLGRDLVTVISDREASSVVAAHGMDSYVRTAIEADQATNPGLERVLDKLELPRQPGTSSKYQLLNAEDSQ